MGEDQRWTRIAPHHGLVNGERARIAAIGAKRVRFESEDGRAYALARSDEQLHHLDHAYSSTVHAAQGMTCDAVSAVLDADHGPITDQARFYVELTRARDNVVLLTTDREALAGVLGALDACLETRTVRLRQAIAAGRAITALAGHAAWSRHVATALGRARALRSEEAGRVEGAPERLAGTVAALERASAFDARAEALLGDWARHCEGARARGRPFLHRSGYAALHRRIEALSREATHPGELPPALARVLTEHAALAADRDAVRCALRTLREAADARDALVDEALAEGEAVAQLARYAPWRAHVRDVCTTTRRVRNAAEHQGARWRGFDAGRGRLGARLRALDYDATSQALLTALRADREAAATPPAPEQLDVAFLRRVRAHAHDATRPGELPPPLAAWLADRDTVHSAHEALRRCATTRAALRAEAERTGLAITELAEHDAWRKAAETARLHADAVVDDGDRYRAHVENLGETWKDFAGAARSLGRGLDCDDRARAASRRCTHLEQRSDAAGIHPFYCRGFDALFQDIEKLFDEYADLAEVPPQYLALLAAGPWRLARETRAALEESESARARLVRESRAQGKVLWEHERYAPWREHAVQARADARQALAEAKRFAAHLDKFEDWRTALTRATQTLDAGLDFDARAEALLERRRRHGLDAGRAAAPSDFYAPWYAGYIADAEKLEPRARHSAEIPAVFTRDLDAHAESVLAQERAKACAQAPRPAGDRGGEPAGADAARGLCGAARGRGCGVRRRTGDDRRRSNVRPAPRGPRGRQAGLRAKRRGAALPAPRRGAPTTRARPRPGCTPWITTDTPHSWNVSRRSTPKRAARARRARRSRHCSHGTANTRPTATP